MSERKMIGALALICMLSAMPVAFANRPDAGSLMNELEPERHVTRPPKKVDIDLNYPTVAQQGNEETIEVDKIVFDWVEKELLEKQMFHRYDNKSSLEVLEFEANKIVTKNLKKSMSFNGLVKIAEAVSLRMRALGYPTAVAFLPKQNMEDKTLKMKVVLGTYDDYVLNNRSAVADKVLHRYMTNMEKGQLISTKSLNKSLLLLNELPGLMVKANLAPGSSFGTASLIADADSTEHSGGSVYVDNYGNRTTGRYRYGANYHYNNINKIGDQLQVNYMRSHLNDLDNYSVMYEMPIGYHGLKWKTSLSRMTYEFLGEDTGLNYLGKSHTFDTSLELPYDKTIAHSHSISLNYSRKLIEDENPGFLTQKSSDAVTLVARGYKRSSRDTFTYDLSHTWGNMHMDNDMAKSIDSTNKYKKEGSFNHANATLWGSHYFSPKTYFQVSLTGQTSWGRVLDSSEKFYISGPTGVRAYPSGEGSGDWGLLGSAELHMETKINGLSVVAFYDAGYARDAKPDTTGDLNNKFLAGAGLGLVYVKSRDLYCKLDWAVPITDRFSKSYDKNIRNMIWFRLVKQI